MKNFRTLWLLVLAVALVSFLVIGCSGGSSKKSSSETPTPSPTATVSPDVTPSPTPTSTPGESLTLSLTDFTEKPFANTSNTLVTADVAGFTGAISMLDNGTVPDSKAILSYALSSEYTSGTIELDFYVVMEGSNDPVTGTAFDVDGSGSKNSSTFYVDIQNADGKRMYECKVDASGGKFKAKDPTDATKSAYMPDGTTVPVVWDGWYHLKMTWNATIATYTISGSGLNGATEITSATTLYNENDSTEWPIVTAQASSTPAYFVLMSGDSNTKSSVYVKNITISNN